MRKIVMLAAVLLSSTSAFAAKIAIVTPYLAQPGTQYYVEAFQEVAKQNGWTVNVVDTKGDIAGVISRIEDAANQKVDAIVLNADPSQVTAGLETAKTAGVPVFGMDAGADPLLVANVTSNGYEMAATTASYVVNRIGGKGGVVEFVFDAFPPVQVRGVIADAIFKNNPDIKIIDRVTPDVQDGGIARLRAPRWRRSSPPIRRRARSPAVWAAWDQPALGALQAIEAAGRTGTRESSSPAWTPTRRRARPSPRAAISKPRWLRTSRASAATVAETVKRHLAGEKIKQSVIYVPTKLDHIGERQTVSGAGGASRASKSLLSIADLSKAYGGAVALRCASLDARRRRDARADGRERRRQVLRSSRSSLAPVAADGGEISSTAGRALRSPDEAHRRGLRFIHQELNVVPGLSVAENIFLGRAYPGRFGLVNWRALHRRAQAALGGARRRAISRRRLASARCQSATGCWSRSPPPFSTTQAPSRAFSCMDEPTAALAGERIATRLFRIIAACAGVAAACLCLAPARRGARARRPDHRAARRRDRGDARLGAKDATKAQLIALMTGGRGVEARRRADAGRGGSSSPSRV